MRHFAAGVACLAYQNGEMSAANHNANASLSGLRRSVWEDPSHPDIPDEDGRPDHSEPAVSSRSGGAVSLLFEPEGYRLAEARLESELRRAKARLEQHQRQPQREQPRQRKTGPREEGRFPSITDVLPLVEPGGFEPPTSR